MDTLGTLHQLGTLGEEQDPTGALNAVTYANQMGAPALPTENAALIAQQYLRDKSIYDQMLQQKIAAGARAESLARQKQAEWEAAAPLREKTRKAAEEELAGMAELRKYMQSNKKAAAEGQMYYYVVNAMSDVLNMPEEQQAAAFEQRKRHLISVGVDPELFEDTYNPESFRQGLEAMAPIAQTWAELNIPTKMRNTSKFKPYVDEAGQVQYLRENEEPPEGWKPFKAASTKTYNIPNEEESFLLHKPQFDLTTEEGKAAALKWLRSPEGQAEWDAEKARKEASAIRIAGAKTTAGEAAREPSRVRDDEIGMAKEYEAASKPFVNIKNIFEPAAKYAKGVETGRVNPSPAQDRDFVISFLKTITPTQAPEKWTMMNIDQLPPLPTRILRGIQNLVQGRQLDDQTRAEMAAAMFSRFETYNSDQAALEEATLRRAQNYGFKPENVVPRHHAIRPGGKKSEGGTGAPKTAEELLRQKGLLK